MDQTTPNYAGFLEGSSFPGHASLNDYFPYQENDYEIPGSHYFPQDAFAYNNRHCALPESPPDSIPEHCAAININIPQSLVYSPNHPSSYPTSSSTGSGSSGNSIPIPFKSMPAAAINHPSFHSNGAKRMRGAPAVPCTSPMSCKQEEDVEFLSSGSGSGSGYGSAGGQFYQEPPFPDSSDAFHRNIDFKPIFREQWCQTIQADGQSVAITDFKVQADKGFNFSQAEEAFICQKKNHFQVTVQLGMNGIPNYIQKTSPTGVVEYQEITAFYLDLFGVKAEAIHQTVKVDQSQSDRSRKEFKAHLIPALNLQQQLTIGRLHFYETTQNNMRKKGKPNPDQRFFKLVVGLYAETIDVRTGGPIRHLLYATASENIVVRASNPGQFENDSAPVPSWQRAQHEEDAVFHLGNVGINTDRPEEALDVRGNMRLTGRMIQPSDARAKDILCDADPTKQLENIRKLRIVRYKYKDQVVAALNLSEPSKYDTGILAQDVMETIPEAVEIVGDLNLEDGDTLEDFLMVNKDRLYMEGLGAVQALSILADDYGNRLTELERRFLRRFAHLKSRDSFRSNFSAATAQTIYSSVRTGTSNSARPSVYSINVPRPNHLQNSNQKKKPGGFSPKTVLGENYVQWLTLGLVMVISICLIAILSLYLVSFNRDASSPEPLSQSTAGQIFQTSSVFPESTSSNPQTVTGTTRPGGNGGMLITTEGDDHPPSKPFVVTTAHTDEPNESWSNVLFATGPCTYIMPIASDNRCVTNATFAEMYCEVWPVSDSCCPDYAGRPSEQQIPEAIYYPEYRTENEPVLPHNLLISFDVEEKDQHTDGKASTSADAFVVDNLIPQELGNGQAVLYQPIHTDVQDNKNVNLKHIQDPTCNITDETSNTADFKWKLLKGIRLVNPAMYLDGSYCFRKDKPCGADNTYIIPLPVSRYYSRAELTVVFDREPDTALVVCRFQILNEGCSNRSRIQPLSWQRSNGKMDQMSLSVDNFAHRQLEVRVAPQRVASSVAICETESPEIYKYNLVIGRSCK